MFDILKMFGVIIRSLFKKTACDRYPFKKPTFYDRTRGSVVLDNETCCTLCTLCARKCPTGAINVDREKRTWEIDHYKCILCGLCVEACNFNCLRMRKEYTSPSTEKHIECLTIPEKPQKTS